MENGKRKMENVKSRSSPFAVFHFPFSISTNVAAQIPAEVLDRLPNAIQVRVDLQRTLVRLDRLAGAAQMGVGMAHARERAEMAWHELDRAHAVGDRILVALAQIIGDRALVVRLGEIRGQ